MTGNRITTLPPEIQKLSHLKELSLYNNRIEKIPPEIGALAQLEYLDIRGNMLSDLPVELFNLKRLKFLHLHGNQIKTVPPEIGKLTQLRELTLHSNQLKALPFELSQLPNLQYLYLHNNPDLNLPLEILGTAYDDRNELSTPTPPRYIFDHYFTDDPRHLSLSTEERKNPTLGVDPETSETKNVISTWEIGGDKSTELEVHPGESKTHGGPASPAPSDDTTLSVDDMTIQTELDSDIRLEVSPKDIYIDSQGHPQFRDAMPTSKDRLGREQLVDVLAAIINDPLQATPQTFALFAPWGEGKSSVMEMLRQRLDPAYCRRKDNVEKNGTIHSIPPWPLKWEKRVLKFFREWKDWRRKLKEWGRLSKERIDTAWLNAWEYEHTENLAAALAQEIVRGVRARMSWHSVEGLLTYAEYIFRRHCWRLLWSVCLVWIIVLIGFLLPSFKIPGIDVQTKTLGWLTCLVVFVVYILPKSKDLFTHPLAASFRTYLKVLEYDKQLGNLPIIREDLRVLSKVRLGVPSYHRFVDYLHFHVLKINPVERSPRRLVVFVDDLDRCSSECIVETLDALRLVLDLKHVFVVVGVDHRIALTAVAKQYKELEGDGRTRQEIARDYLGKIIQIPITLQPSSQEDMEDFVRESLFSVGSDETDELILSDVCEAAVDFIKNPSNDTTEENELLGIEQEPRPILFEESTGEEDRPTEEAPEEIPDERETTPSMTEEEKLQEVMKHDPKEKRWFYFLQCSFDFTNPRQLMRLADSYSLLKALLHQKGQWQTEKNGLEREKRYEILRMLFYLEFINNVPMRRRDDFAHSVESDAACNCSEKKRDQDLIEKQKTLWRIMRLDIGKSEPWKDRMILMSINDNSEPFDEMKRLVKTVVLPALVEENNEEDKKDTGDEEVISTTWKGKRTRTKRRKHLTR